MAKFIDRTGEIHGRLTVLTRAGTSTSKKVLWKCLCACGNETITTSGSLITGNTTSCGCYLKERITKHGGTGKGSYNTWRAMMRRCYVPEDKDYRKYGAMGVTVCQEWHVYLTFARDMGEPVGAETLDRIDTYGNYEPGNCRWASITVQNRNVRVRKESKSGHIGVYSKDDKWFARVTAKGRYFCSKAFNSIEEAVAARKQLEALHWN